jgi:hypothetical protein
MCAMIGNGHGRQNQRSKSAFNFVGKSNIKVLFGEIYKKFGPGTIKCCYGSRICGMSCEQN